MEWRVVVNKNCADSQKAAHENKRNASEYGKKTPSNALTDGAISTGSSMKINTNPESCRCNTSIRLFRSAYIKFRRKKNK